MSHNINTAMGQDSILKTEDYILYILNHLEPEKSDFWCLNKIAFLVEFAFFHLKDKELSNAEYAAIDHGPVIDDYRELLESMKNKGLIKIDGYKVRLVDSRKIDVPQEVSEVITPLIKRYAQMSPAELKAFTHAMDSYKLTTNNERVMGKKISKKLAHLETFFSDSNGSEEFEDDSLPLTIDRSKLIEI
jgi:uncharacterized phage-associated protein